MQSREPLWTIDELSAQAALALAVDYPGPLSARVREVPDRRTIRYYATLGLIDRPAAMRGRTALYGRRHLLQLVAIKRLQARGLALAEVQSRLLGRTDSALEALARLPAPGEAAPSAETAAPGPAEDRRASAFWREPPAPVAPAESGPDGEARPPLLTGVPLAPGATLLLEAARDLDDHDLA